MQSLHRQPIEQYQWLLLVLSCLKSLFYFPPDFNCYTSPPRFAITMPGGAGTLQGLYCSKTNVDRIGQDSHFLASYHISLTYHLQVLLLSGLGRCAQPIKDIFWSQMGSTPYQKRKFHDSLFYCTYLCLLPWVTFLVKMF